MVDVRLFEFVHFACEAMVRGLECPSGSQPNAVVLPSRPNISKAKLKYKAHMPCTILSIKAK